MRAPFQRGQWRQGFPQQQQLQPPPPSPLFRLRILWKALNGCWWRHRQAGQTEKQGSGWHLLYPYRGMSSAADPCTRQLSRTYLHATNMYLSVTWCVPTKQAQSTQKKEARHFSSFHVSTVNFCFTRVRRINKLGYVRNSPDNWNLLSMTWEESWDRLIRATGSD